MPAHPFTYRSGLDSGLTPGELRSAHWNHEIRGMRTELRALDIFDLCRLVGGRIQQAFFSHRTAALLLGMPLPWAMKNVNELDVAVAAPARAPHASGLRGHELEVQPGQIVTSRGILHTSAARTWCDLASILPLYDLVAAGDYLIQRQLPIATVRQLAECAEHFIGKRGMRSLREALGLLSDRSESPPESILRVIIHQGGLPTPKINHTLVDTETGRQLRPDFLFENEKVLLEYQGDYHRTKEQWRKDMTRRSRLEAAGWRVMELNWDDLDDPVELVARIRSLLYP